MAEASSSMPLKTLHPLLEDGVHFDEEDERKLMNSRKKGSNQNKAASSLGSQSQNNDWHKVGFIGISNWVLDPAKMNRGIFVNRSSPSINELKEIVIGICKNDEAVLKALEDKNIIDSLSKAYTNLCNVAKKQTREFFGLRDFYSLIKMIYWNIKENGAESLDWEFLNKGKIFEI